MTTNKKIGVILLAGGQGLRFGSAMPKQFLPINGKPIALYSFEIFVNRNDIAEIVVVCAEPYKSYFCAPNNISIKFAEPGERRQDSVYNGLQKLDPQCEYVCVHDAARPLISHQLLDSLFEETKRHGAATIGVPIKFTVKECNDELIVNKTPDRSKIWEIQTPQMMHSHLIQKGFAKAKESNATVTDDVSLVELLNLPVKIVKGDYSNLKITTAEDLYLAEKLINEARR